MPQSILRLLGFSRQVQLQSQATTMSRAQLDRVQKYRLQKLLRHSATHSPFYGERLHQVNFQDPDLSSVPHVSKRDMIENLNRVFTDRELRSGDLAKFTSDELNLGKWHLGRYAVSHTSGSQGQPLLIVQDRECINRLFSIMASRSSTTRRPGIFEAIQRWRTPKRIAVVTFKRGFYPSAAALEFLQETMSPFVDVRRFSSLQDDLLEQLNAFQPHSIFSYASVLETLSYDSHQLKLQNLEHLSSSSEQLTLSTRSKIEKAFQVPVLNHYGAGECLQLADTCKEGSLHINADWCILEVVDDYFEPVPDGAVGSRILVTNLANFTQPFIRYVLEDRVAIERNHRCKCGSNFPIIVKMDGRSADIIRVIDSDGREKRLTGIVFHSVFDSCGEHVREWQIHQLSTDSLLVKVVWQHTDPRLHRAISCTLTSKLRSSGVPKNVQIEFSSVEAIPSDHVSGKMRRLLPRAI